MRLDQTPEFFDVFFDLAQSGLAQVRRGYGGWVPEVYDLMEGDFQDDIPLVLDLAAESGGPVVDLGAGTGRLTLPLLEAGHHVFAVDSDPDMLDRLRSKAAGAGAPGATLTAMPGDIRSFRLPAPARLAVCSTNTFLYLSSQQEQRRALMNIHRNLEAGGMLWLDVFVPKPNPSADEPYLTSRIVPQSGSLLLYGAQNREDDFAGTCHVNAFTMVLRQGQPPDIYVQSWTYAWLRPSELKLLLEATGFELVRLLGDYEEEPADEASVQMIAIARKVG